MNVAREALLLVPPLARAHLTSKSAPIRCYAFKSDLKIKWVRPEKIPCYKPEKSGDLASFYYVDPAQPQLKYRNSKELEDANEQVKKLFSLEFAPRKNTAEVYFRDIVDKVKRHPYDVGSVEVRIAKWTGVIRAFQEVMDRFPRNTRMKVVLKELIDRRKKQLKYLRRWDYKRFEWLIETLDLVYKPPPNEFRWVARKESLVKLTDKYCENIRNERLETYRLILEAEQPIFLQEKVKALEFIRKEQVDCGVEVTITEEEIAGVRQQLQELEAEREKASKDT